jgi:hypothetical protein
LGKVGHRNGLGSRRSRVRMPVLVFCDGLHTQPLCCSWLNLHFKMFVRHGIKYINCKLDFYIPTSEFLIPTNM